MEGGEERAHLDFGRAWIEGEGERTGIFTPLGPRCLLSRSILINCAAQLRV